MTKDEKENRSLVLSLVAIVVGMVMLSYASVPLYRLFCQVTGYGGTTTEVTLEDVPATPSEQKLLSALMRLLLKDSLGNLKRNKALSL